MRRAARRQLPIQLGHERSGRVLATADADYPSVAARIPPAGPGARHLLRLGAYAAALGHALDEVGYDTDQANVLISDIVFASIMPARSALYRLGRLRHRDPMAAARWSSRVGQRLYYTEPDWEMDDVSVKHGFGMDVTRCPVAEFFESLDMSDLCQRAICDQDIRSAAHHGLVLERSGTLAGGADRCDFRYTRSDSGRPTEPRDGSP